DNLAKRREVSDDKCLFCCENESVQYLFFDCVVARNMWQVVSDALGVNIKSNFMAIGRMWLSNKKFAVHNIVCAAALWSIWKLKNSIYFQNTGWRCMRILIWRVAELA
ncbi:hypothetical protein BS78_01G413200, partial [Paspalum vaginatum]